MSIHKISIRKDSFSHNKCSFLLLINIDIFYLHSPLFLSPASIGQSGQSYWVPRVWSTRVWAANWWAQTPIRTYLAFSLLQIELICLLGHCMASATERLIDKQDHLHLFTFLANHWQVVYTLWYRSITFFVVFTSASLDFSCHVYMGNTQTESSFTLQTLGGHHNLTNSRRNTSLWLYRLQTIKSIRRLKWYYHIFQIHVHHPNFPPIWSSSFSSDSLNLIPNLVSFCQIGIVTLLKLIGTLRNWSV